LTRINVIQYYPLKSVDIIYRQDVFSGWIPKPYVFLAIVKNSYQQNSGPDAVGPGGSAGIGVGGASGGGSGGGSSGGTGSAGAVGAGAPN
jgi:hypothetical protein